MPIHVFRASRKGQHNTVSHVVPLRREKVYLKMPDFISFSHIPSSAWETKWRNQYSLAHSAVGRQYTRFVWKKISDKCPKLFRIP